MAYIYRKTIGGKAYYYLRISERKGKKVITKDVAYLGNDLSQLEGRLDALPAQYKKEIRKGHRAIKRFIDSSQYAKKIGKLKSNPYMSTETHKQVEAARLHFTKEFRKLDSQTQQELFGHFLIDFAYNTTSIEGNTITLEQTHRLLEENIAPKEKSLREIYDLQNTKSVFFWLAEKTPRFSQDLVITIHDKLLENIDVRKGYRNRDIRVFRSRFEASPGKFVRTDMALLFEWYAQYKKKLHPLVLVSLFHQKLEKIHPFYDGNGRTGRMVMNYLLMKHGYPPAIIQKKKRAHYLRILADADEAGIKSVEPAHFKKLVEYIASELVGSYWNSFNI